MLKCANLNFGYQDREILKNISFRLGEGQNLVILGENGAGKSTLAKLLCGLIKTKGGILVFGEELSKLQNKERSKLINYVAPKLNVYDEETTLLEYLLMGRFAYKQKFEPYSKEETDEALFVMRKFRMDELANHRLSLLSSGEKQLAMIMQAVIQNSAITIFDEPIANIDIERSQTLFDALSCGAVFKNKIVITHDLHFAFSLGFDVLYLKSGEIDFFGDSDEFFGEPSLARRFGERILKRADGVYANYAKI